MADQTKATTKGQDAGKAQERKKRPEPAPEQTGALAAESISFVGLLGDSAMELPVERHAAVLSDPRLSHSANAAQRAGMVSQIQRTYGNVYVQRLMDLTQPRSNNGASGQKIDKDVEMGTVGEKDSAHRLNSGATSPLALRSPSSPVTETRPGDWIARLVEYNEDVKGGRFTDPEQAKGRLPFTKDGWDGKEIARKLSQLNNATTSDDNVRCVQTSFLVALVQRGPGAVRTMIENYLRRYRVGLRQASTPARIKRWYKRSISNLKPLLAKIDAQTLTYGDLSTILTEMYDVYGSNGTSAAAELSMPKREGYKAVGIYSKNVTRKKAAAEAKKLKKGEFLSCGVHCSKEGYQPAGHAVHIGRHPDGTLYFYDPWPVKGDQMIELSEDLKEIEHYFVNPLQLPGLFGFPPVEIKIPRTFDIDIKFSPPEPKKGGTAAK